MATQAPKTWEEMVRTERPAELRDYWQAVQAQMKVCEDVEVEVEPVQQCAVCGDTGYVKVSVPVTHELFGKLVFCPEQACAAAAQMRERAWKNRLKSARLPEEYELLSFQTWEQYLAPEEKQGKWEAYNAALLFAQRDDHLVYLEDVATLAGVRWDNTKSPAGKRSLVFWGAVGMGKTGLAAGIIRALLDQGKSVLYTRTRDFIHEIQERYNTDKRYESQNDVHMDVTATEALRLYQKAPILVLDEFNIGNPKPDRLEIVESLIRYRHGHRLPTIVTCNIDQEQCYAMWGERTADVLLQMAHWIHVGGLKLRNTERSAGDF